MGSSLWRRSCTLSTLILVFWTSRSLHLNNSSIWGHYHSNFWNFTKNNLWEPINDLCHELYFSSWNCSLGTSVFSADFRPAISASRRALRSAYVSATSSHSEWILVRYSFTASNSACTPVRSAINSPENLSNLWNSLTLNRTSC